MTIEMCVILLLFINKKLKTTSYEDIYRPNMVCFNVSHNF